MPLLKDGLVTNSSNPNSKIEYEENTKNGNTLLKNQELVLDVLKHEENFEDHNKLQNPSILSSMEKPTIDRKKTPVQYLQKEIKITKNELKQLKEKKAKDSKAIQLLFSKP